MPSWPALAVALLLLASGAAAAFRAADHARVLRRVRTLEPMSIAAAAAGLHLVRGRLEGEPLLASPYQGRPCVYYFFRVQSAGETRRGRPLATGKEWSLAAVRDASGVVAIEPWTALVASPRRFTATLAGLRRIPPELAPFFERAGIEEKHLARLGAIEVHEFTLEPGDDVEVLGTMRDEDGNRRLVRAKRRPFVVSATSATDLARPGLRSELLLYGFLAPLLVAAGATVGAFGLTG